MTPTTPLTSSTQLLARLASWKLWIASALILVPLAWMFFTSSASFAVPEVEAACGQAPPDMRFFTTADGVTQFLDECGPEGRDAYRSMQLVDIFYPAVVGVFLASSLSLAVRRLFPHLGPALWLVALPLAGAAFDYLENALAWLALASYPDPVVTSNLLGVASAAKTSTSWVAGLTLVAALVALAARAGKAWLSGATAETARALHPSDERETVGSAS